MNAHYVKEKILHLIDLYWVGLYSCDFRLNCKTAEAVYILKCYQFLNSENGSFHYLVLKILLCVQFNDQSKNQQKNQQPQLHVYCLTSALKDVISGLEMAAIIIFASVLAGVVADITTSLPLTMTSSSSVSSSTPSMFETFMFFRSSSRVEAY